MSRGKIIQIGSGPAAPKSRKKRLPKTLTTPEAEALLAQPNIEKWRGLRDRCILELMYRAGLRVGETTTLTMRDVDLDTGAIAIFDGKGGDGTAYFDADRVSPLLQKWIDERAGRGFRLFVKENGDPVTVRYIQRMVKKYASAAGITTRCTPHTLRHTYATELLRDGFTLREVQEALRHANVSTTEVYTAVVDEDLRKKMQKRNRRSQ